jgi:hypothetical protein
VLRRPWAGSADKSTWDIETGALACGGFHSGVMSAEVRAFCPSQKLELGAVIFFRRTRLPVGLDLQGPFRSGVHSNATSVSFQVFAREKVGIFGGGVLHRSAAAIFRKMHNTGKR